MILEEVHIEGFKSFSEKTEMGFQPGIGVVIGNNGVGKSNILDAIVWALGEDRLDRVRCYERDELFFAGSKNTPPAERFFIELILRDGPEENATRVRLSRETPREGRERYRIDGKTYSREQYRNRLEDFQLRQSLKTIVRQEEINDILLLPPRQRFSSVTALLGLVEESEAVRRLNGDIAERFVRYMGHLMPLAEVGLGMISQNGKRGLEIEANLPGNRRRRAHQLSGGEKAITSLALKLAVFHELESPFFLLDEVEPSLDYTNHKSMQAFLKDVAAEKQLIMITHLRSTIELANTLHGVRTRFDGSSFMKFYFVMDERLLRLYKCC